MRRFEYQEDDWIAEVEMIADKSNDEFISYDLKVIKTIQESKIYKSTLNGTVFNCCRHRDYSGILWRLDSLE